MMVELKERMVRPRIGLLPTGHLIYWDQFPGLKGMCLNMYEKARQRLGKIGEVITPGLVDTQEKAWEASKFFQTENIDILLVFPLGYTTGIVVLPCVKQLDVPIRILNTHLDGSYDYKTADTTIYLYHEGPCCIPEYAAGLVNMGRKFKVRTGVFSSQRFWQEVAADCNGSAAARAFRSMNVGIIGETYTSPLLRKEFEITQDIRRGRVYISGLGWHELYINGKKVSDHVLDPAMTNYQKHIFYLTHDVTDMLRRGQNTIAVWLGNGWYSETGRQRYGDSPVLLAQMNITFIDESTMSVNTDTSWTVSAIPIFSMVPKARTMLLLALVQDFITLH